MGKQVVSEWKNPVETAKAEVGKVVETAKQFREQLKKLIDGKGAVEKSIADHIADLAKYREEHGIPKARSEGDKATVSKIVIDGKEFYGINKGLQNPKANITMNDVNPITKTHAESHAAQQIIDAGLKGTAKTVELFVDRDPCGACGTSNGIGSIAREIGADEIIVHSPSGTKVYTPPSQ
jgi:hypothetical protein